MASSSRAAGGAADLADSGTTDHVRPGDGAPDGAESGSGEDSRAAGGAAAGPAPSLASRLLVLPIRAYQRFLSPALPPACRFTPTCSEYAVVAISRHGPFKGSWLAVRRLARCHPWHPGGDDPVP